MKVQTTAASDSAFHRYLQDIGRTPLLTAAEEIQLAKRIRRGDRKAREKMITANLRLVVKLAHDYANLGLPMADLVSEGNIGLMKAVERFEPDRGAKFSTYAAWWIKQTIRRALSNQGRTIRLPVHIVDRICRVNRQEFELAEKLGHEPTTEELAKHVGTTPERIDRLRQAASIPASLNARLGDGENDGEFGELIGDAAAPTPYEVVRDRSLRPEVEELLTSLNSREATIIIKRFGLDGETPWTLEQVGRKFKITRERIRQLQNIALKKLQRASARLNLPELDFSLN